MDPDKSAETIARLETLVHILFANDKEKSQKIRELEDYKSNIAGRIAVIVIVGGGIWSIVVGLMFYMINKK